MTRPLVLFLLAALLLAVPLFAAPTSFSPSLAQVPQPGASSAPELSFWTDSAGDVWVESPLYTWNITSGAQIHRRDDGAAWLSAAPGERLADRLFLFSNPTGDLSARVVFALPDEGLVAVERSSPSGRETLWLAFRAEDALITLSHTWSAADGAPARSSGADLLAGLTSAAAGEPLAWSRGVLPAAAQALSPRSYAYQLGQAGELGAALLQPASTGDSSEMILPASLTCLGGLPAGLSLPSEPVGHCPPPPASHGDGPSLARRYLLLLEGSPQEAARAVEETSLRLQLALPDLNAASIGRTPRYDYDRPKNQPYPGETVTFSARLANRGGAPSGPFTYTWSIDGAVVRQSDHPGLLAGEIIEVSLEWPWQSGVHSVSIQVQGSPGLVEVSERNNRLEDRTGALALGLWVEQSVYDWFNQEQAALGLGGVSWDDWAQRQVRVWNQMFAQAVYPLTPQGIVERVRLDKVVVVPDGSLPGPYPTNYPAVGDKGVDLMWGFPCELVGACQLRPGYAASYPHSTEAGYVEYSLLHELSHARYLDDLYGLNVVAEPAYLAAGVGAQDTVLLASAPVEGLPHFQAPVYLALGGELVLCEQVSGATFLGCQRGAEGTFPRAHPAGERLNRAAVRAQDGLGSLVMGSPALPLVGWSDHLFFNPYMDDLMSGGTLYQTHSAYALNRIAGMRPVCGSYNAPCNLGEYQNDVPEENILVLTRAGAPVEGARVEVFRARPLEHIWYAKQFLREPDAVLVSAADGRASLGAFPFDVDGEVKPYNRVVLLHIRYQGISSYRFFDITQANEAYWSGQQAQAHYLYELPLSAEADVWVDAPAELLVEAGGRVEIDLRYGNQGLAPAAGITLRLRFDPALSAASISQAVHQASAEELTWVIPGLGSMQRGSLRAAFVLPQAAPGERFSIRIEARANSPDEDLSNNTAQVAVQVGSALRLPLVQNGGR
jgi:hypothetical protein